MKEKLFEIYPLLEEPNQQFVVEQFSVYCDIEEYEIAIVEAFSRISEKKKEFVLNSLNVVHLVLYPASF